MSDSSKSYSYDTLGIFGLWQVLYFVLKEAIDAPWNRVQDWPWFDWWSFQSVMFPFMISVLAAIVGIIIVGVIAIVTVMVGK